MLLWSKRLAEWRHVVAQKDIKVSGLALVRALLSGPVPKEVWRQRMRTCLGCPVYHSELKACHVKIGDDRTLGCGCYAPFVALTAVPYTKQGGCWAREATREADPSGQVGWGAFIFPSWRARLRSIVRFFWQ